MKARSAWWLLFGGGVLAVMLALVWVSEQTLRLERAELEARAEAAHQASVRLAMWKMDSWLGPLVAREAVRPYFEYLPFFAHQRAYTKILSEIEPGEVYSPSPLLTFESELFPLHFQVNSRNEVMSPQAPEGNWRDLAETCCLSMEAIEAKRPMLERVRALIQPKAAEFMTCVAEAETMNSSLLNEPPSAFEQVPVEDNRQWAAGAKQAPSVQKLLSKADVQSRAQTNYGQSQTAQTLDWIAQPQTDAATRAGMADEAALVEVGPLVPLWLHAQPATLVESSQPQLVFVRRVHANDEVIHQGFVTDWEQLSAALSAQIDDLLPQAELAPVMDSGSLEREAETGRLLAGAPVKLLAECPPPVAASMLTPARATLGLAWITVIGAVIVAGLTLRSSINYGEKRSRFASAVTHELRTPLTTFKMYSEMLAEGMVKDEAQRKEYLSTLKSESGRLATLVENVLSYARLEDGRAASHKQPMTVRSLLDRLTPMLRRRAEEAKMNLCVETTSSAPVSDNQTLMVDADVVGQILFNLVDNACKYSNGSVDRTIELQAALENASLKLSVCDHGPGIPAHNARSIFKPFDRGGHGPGDTIPGVGLGLALSRGLARDLGGELELEPGRNGEAGARFTLTLPR